MKEGYTHISVILDRSGSMAAIADDVVGGFNSFIARQREMAGDATLTLVQFDDHDPYEVIHNRRPLGEVEPLTRETYVPRGLTPLLDAMGRGILDLDSMLAAMAEEELPQRVIMVFVTDGQENASREFKREAVTKLVEERQSGDKPWDILFLSADLEAIGEARDLRIAYRSSIAFDADAMGVSNVFESLCAVVSDARLGESAEFKPRDRARQVIDDPLPDPEEDERQRLLRVLAGATAEAAALDHELAVMAEGELDLLTEVARMEAQMTDLRRHLDHLAQELQRKVDERDSMLGRMECLQNRRQHVESVIDGMQDQLGRTGEA